MTCLRCRCVTPLLIEEAASGNVAAICALADRLDGKVPQATGQSDELGPTRLHISWRGGGTAEETTAVASPVLIALRDADGSN
jgi:hypothetical protein